MDVDPGFPQSNSGVWSLNTFFFDVPLQRDKIPLITRALPLAAINYQVQYEAVNRFCHFVVVFQDTKESWKQKYLTEGGGIFVWRDRNKKWALKEVFIGR